MKFLSILSVLSAFLWSCTATQEEPPSIPKWSKETAILVEQCKTERIPELQTICWVEAAAQSVRQKKQEQAVKICKEMSDGIWKRECYFRLGEELAIVGEWSDGIYWCTKAGQFAQSCITHSFWKKPLRDLPSIDASPQEIKAALEKLRTKTQEVLQHQSKSLLKQSLDNISAQFAHSLIVGSGRTRADLAHEKGNFGRLFRTVYGIEAARILSNRKELSLETILESWKAKKDIYGPQNKRSSFKGRYRHTKPPLQEKGSPRIVSFTGYSRLYVQDMEQDMKIAALEGAFWIESTKASFFKPYIRDTHNESRWTAQRLFQDLSQSSEHRRKPRK